MEHYQTSGPRSSLKKAPLPPCGGGALPLLVNRSISQNRAKGFQVYPSAVRIIREDYPAVTRETPPSPRAEVQGFSEKSRRRLRFLAGNTSTRLISQFCLTYQDARPDGKTCKKHLNAWLQRIRILFPDVAYLWVLEFQSRGVPHFHVWLSLHHETPGLRSILAKAWHRIADPDSPSHLAFHQHRDNFIAWDMYSPGYLVKYLDKQHQKAVPAGFTGVGRFWGNSRGLLAIPEEITAEDLEYLLVETVDPETGEVTETDAAKYLVRTMGKLHERKLRGSPWRSKARSGMTTYTLHTLAPSFRRLLDYLRKSYESENDIPF